MNKKLVAVAVAAGLVLPMISAQAVEVADKKLEVYGKLHVSLSSIDAAGTTADNYLLESHASRIGFKGAIPLDGGLVGTYKYEVEADVTDGTLLAGQRNTYLGLKGSFGEFRLGRHDSPLKMAQGKFDQFGDTAGDLKNAGSHDGENRNASSITYLGKFDNLAVNVQLIPGEGNGTAAGQGITDTTSIGVSYKAGPLYLAVANDSYDDTGAAAGTDS
ncbi:MAG: porin, partial [Gammaproteobacteria bacterium]|nr:porin [Gammaproteobacteria bacterium]